MQIVAIDIICNSKSQHPRQRSCLKFSINRAGQTNAVLKLPLTYFIAAYN